MKTITKVVVSLSFVVSSALANANEIVVNNLDELIEDSNISNVEIMAKDKKQVKLSKYKIDYYDIQNLNALNKTKQAYIVVLHDINFGTAGLKSDLGWSNMFLRSNIEDRINSLNNEIDHVVFKMKADELYYSAACDPRNQKYTKYFCDETKRLIDVKYNNIKNFGFKDEHK